jgi:hypothetical protein
LSLLLLLLLRLASEDDKNMSVKIKNDEIRIKIISERKCTH